MPSNKSSGENGQTFYIAEGESTVVVKVVLGVIVFVDRRHAEQRSECAARLSQNKVRMSMDQYWRGDGGRKVHTEWCLSV